MLASSISRRIFQVAVRLRAAPLNQRIAHYYVKPKKKKGASTQAWMALAGVSATLTGVGVYILGEHYLGNSSSG